MKKLLFALSVLVLFAVAMLGVAAALTPSPTVTLLSTLPSDVRSAVPYRDGLLLAVGEAGLYRVDGAGAVDPVQAGFADRQQQAVPVRCRRADVRGQR